MEIRRENLSWTAHTHTHTWGGVSDACQVVSETKKRGHAVQCLPLMQSAQGSRSGYTASLQYRRWEAATPGEEITTTNVCAKDTEH